MAHPWVAKREVSLQMRGQRASLGGEEGAQQSCGVLSTYGDMSISSVFLGDVLRQHGKEPNEMMFLSYDCGRIVNHSSYRIVVTF